MLGFLKKRGKNKLWFNIILLLILPLVSVLIVLILVQNFLNLRIQDQGETKLSADESALKPSQLLNDKKDHANQELVLRGRVVKEPAVCQKKECPEADSCCGCPEKRDLIIYDENTSLGRSTGGRLQLLTSENDSFCRREIGTCDYQCGDWLEGGIYQVEGTFFYRKPPPGWATSFEYHFVVQEKKLLGTVDLGKNVTNFWQELMDKLKGFSTSGSYVLP